MIAGTTEEMTEETTEEATGTAWRNAVSREVPAMTDGMADIPRNGAGRILTVVTSRETGIFHGRIFQDMGAMRPVAVRTGHKGIVAHKKVRSECGLFCVQQKMTTFIRKRYFIKKAFVLYLCQTKFQCRREVD